MLGSTGSIGTQTLEICRQHPQRLQIVGLTAHQNGTILQEQAAEFGVANIALMDEQAAMSFGIAGGLEAVTQVATLAKADLVVVAVAGVIGLKPTLAAIEAGKDIALASKEVLVAAGEIVMPAIKKYGVQLTPIDSEHSAIFQCLQGYTPDQVKSITLTASGGPFRGKTSAELAGVTVEQTLNHPNWSMGGKITVDSATLMNKGLETIEARWLFDLDISQVKAVIHPQSIIHSMVEMQDGSYLAQLGWPDMKLPIQYALLYPDRVENQLRAWNPLESSPLTFEPIDNQTFPAIELAKHAAQRGGTAACCLNAANEAAVAHYLQGHCSYLEIIATVEKVLMNHKNQEVNLESLLNVDQTSREEVRQLLGR